MLSKCKWKRRKAKKEKEKEKQRFNQMENDCENKYLNFDYLLFICNLSFLSVYRYFRQ